MRCIFVFFCEGNKVEDLPHFLLLCPRYSAVKAQFGVVVDTGNSFINCGVVIRSQMSPHILCTV